MDAHLLAELKRRSALPAPPPPDPPPLVACRPHPQGEALPARQNRAVEMVYVCAGSVTCVIEGRTVCLETGDLLLMNQYTTCAALPAGPDDLAVDLSIQPAFFDQADEIRANRTVLSDFLVDLLRKTGNWGQYLHFKVAEHLPIHDLMEVLLVSLFPRADEPPRKQPLPADERIVQSCAAMIFYFISKDLTALDCDAPMNYEQVTLRTLQSYVDQHYRDASLGALAEILNCSESALSRQIRRLTGATFTELVQDRRFERARRLLEETSLPVSDIAAAVGYENFSYFYRRFRQKFGCAPNAYRRQRRPRAGS